MILLRVEIDHDLVQEKIPAADLTKSPAFVESKRVRCQLIERGRSLDVEFAGIDHRL